MELLGVDVGFGFTKATNGRDVIVFKSLLGNAADIQYREQLLDPGGAEEHLHVELDGASWFLGELAERQSHTRLFTLDHDQFIARFTRTLALAAVARLAGRNVPVKLVTGLPVSHYRRHRDELGRLLQGKHEMALVDRSGTRVETVLNVDQVRVIPQPFGSLFNLMLNDRGEGGERRFLQEKIGVIDIGFRTADYTISDRTRYSERGSHTSDNGIAEAFGTISARLQEKSGISVELYRLYDAAARGSIKIRGRSYDIRGLVEKVLGQLAAAVSAELDRLWADDWDIDTMVITGGGGAVLAPYLQPLLKGEVLAPESGSDSRLHNVVGYRKYAMNLWMRGMKAAAAAEGKRGG